VLRRGSAAQGLYSYPPRGEVISSLSGYPAPINIGNQMFVQGTLCDMIARCTQQGAANQARHSRRSSC
jgi:hypothetical protein